MGNCNAVCGLNFLSSQDMTQSTLSISPLKKRNKLKSQTLPLSEESDQMSKSCLSLGKKGKSAGELSEKSLKRSKTNSPNAKDKSRCIDNDFRIVKILKDGKMGKVCLVTSDTQQGMYAMKIINKKKGMSQFFPCPPSIEKELLDKASNPFIPELLCWSENERKSILVTEYLKGGSLGKILGQLFRFSEEITKFYCAEVLLALEYLHEKLEVSYNNLSPQNVLLDSDGHIKLISFGSAEFLDLTKTQISPFSSSTDSSPRSGCENRFGPGKMKDYWGFGGFVYELLTGVKPFQGSLEWPQNVSKNARDLVSRLFDETMEKRLGYNGTQEIKQHVFFSGINWERVSQKAVYPPLKPSKAKEPEDEATEEEDDIDCCSIEFVKSGTKLETIKETTSLDFLDEINPAMSYAGAANRI